jgi:hypothetical protein
VPDYAPERGPLPVGVDLAHGIIQSIYKGVATTPGAGIARRLAPHGNGAVTAYGHAILLPSSAPDLLWDFHPFAMQYEAQLLPEQRDLLGITTVRFSHDVPCHVQWELARGWARSSFVAKRNLAVALIHHVPGLSGRSNKPHIHLLWPVRQLHGSTWGAFTDIAKPGARTILATEWASWLEEHA